MSLFNAADRRFAETVAELGYCNPFVPRRIELDRLALGAHFDERFAQWDDPADATIEQPNLKRLLQRTEALLDKLRQVPQAKRDTDPTDAALHEALVLVAAYHRLRGPYARAAAEPRPTDVRRKLFEPLVKQVVEYFGDAERAAPLVAQLPHLAACFFQLARAYHHIFHFVLGASKPAVELRAAAWQSIFTHDMRRYRRILFDRLGDYATLIVGPSGTGKELVARAVGLSRYVPYDEKSGNFAAPDAPLFSPLNLSAMSPTLIESELFGHCRGAFTGATEHREGWLERCSPFGAVFLDEIGELSPAIQVKLLRVLQDRTFQRLGESAPRTFAGKLISATNRDLTQQMQSGEFREDLYYRLCSDVIVTPSLRSRLDDDPQELRRLTTSIARRIVGEEVETVVEEVLRTIDERLGPQYAWPGNVRELEQCVRNVLIRRDYAPPSGVVAAPTDGDRLARDIREANLTADQLVARYCAIVYAQTGSYEATAKRLGLDRRTVKAKVDASRLTEQ